ncbi:MAG: thioredoxin fold domain-containing protein [Hyphomicrobium sp.]|jgi:thioredoxin-related protein
MTKISVFAALLSVLVAGASAARAVPDRDSLPATASAASGIELIAFEVPGCIYCNVFRRDVLPGYASSPTGRAAPIRFLDLNDEASNRLRLNEPVRIVPTIVVMRDGAEVGRIVGYLGAENFYRVLDGLLPRR